MRAICASQQRHWWVMGLIWGLLVLSGCSGVPAAPIASMDTRGAGPASPGRTPVVVVYASPVAQAYWASTAFDGRIHVQAWEVFLRKYQIPFQVLTSVEQLEKTPVNALILPSAVALSAREQRAIAHFRSKGGSVLASWLSGVQNERGKRTGFTFMENTLGVKVVGDTENDAKDNFLIVHGDSPVTHHLPAGMRLWLERLKGLYPLRLEGRHTAAHIMDWSRKTALDKVSATVVFDERVEPSGRSSRAVVFGFSEQLWVSSDPQLREALVHNALWWVLRLPSAYTAAWPHPHRSALVLAVDVAGAITDRDLDNARRLEQAGGRATYFVINDTAARSAERLKRLQSSGHEIAYLGDRYSDFREQPAAVQAQRLDSMLRTMRQHGLAMTPHTGFHPPMDSYDQHTESLLRERTFGYLLGTMDASEARLPFVSTDARTPAPLPSARPPQQNRRLLVLPRTQEGPDELVDNCDPAIGLKPFFKELQLSDAMGSLSVVPFPSRNELTDAQRMEVFRDIAARREHTWLATAGQVAQWWQERERVSVRLASVDKTLRLSVRLAPGPGLTRAPAVWVNLPEMGSTLRLTAPDGNKPVPRVVAVDAWRSAVLLDGLAPGDHQWTLRFERASPEQPLR